MNKIKRESGFYWVRIKGSNFYVGYLTVAYFFELLDFWGIIGSDKVYKDEDFESIIEKKIEITDWF